MTALSVDELRAEVARLETRLREQGSSFCKAHDEATKRANDARTKLLLAQGACVEAEQQLYELLGGTDEEAMPRPLRRRVICALERVQRLRRIVR